MEQNIGHCFLSLCMILDYITVMGLKKKKKKGEMLQYTCISSSVSIKNIHGMLTV